MIRWISGLRLGDAMNPSPGQKSDQFFLWVDAVGGYWVCLGDAVVLGQPGLGPAPDVPILADLSSRHARIRRDAGGYLIEALRDVRVDGRAVERAALLSAKSTIHLGGGVRLLFRRPHALSATARVDFLSRHRTQPSIDALVLMADTCVLGPKAHSHVVCPDWPKELILYRYDGQLYCRTEGPLEIDGVRHEGRGPLTLHSRAVGPWFSFSLEAIGPKGRKADGRVIQ
jgi:hypothetical protein